MDELSARIAAISHLPGRWTAVAAPGSGVILGFGIALIVGGNSTLGWWVIALGIAVTTAWNIAYLPAVCDWRWERRRSALVEAWWAEHPDGTHG